MPDILLKRPEVEKRVGLGRSRIYEMVGEGTFPTPVRIGGAVRWSEREIDDWTEARLAERPRGPRSGDSEPTGRAA
jgi:prophage regulatory protein